MKSIEEPVIYIVSNVGNFEKDDEVNLRDPRSTITGFIDKKPTLFSKRFKELKVGDFLVPIKFFCRGKNDVLLCNSYES